MDSFMDYLTSELTVNNLLYVIDPSILPTRELGKAKLDKNKVKVRDILINRIDMSYHSKVTNIRDSLELLNKIKNIKENETSVTTASLRKQLHSIKYNPNKEKASVFWDKFDDIVCKILNFSKSLIFYYLKNYKVPEYYDQQKIRLLYFIFSEHYILLSISKWYHAGMRCRLILGVINT